MRRNAIHLIIIILVTFFPLKGLAIPIVDTGIPIGSSQYMLHNSGPDFYNFLAGEFSLSETIILTDVYGYMAPFWPPGGSGGEITAIIYGDDGDIPDGNLLHSGTFTVPTLSLEDWYGLSGLSWELQAGTYWVSFEAAESSAFFGGMRFEPPDPLLNTAFNADFTNGWSADPDDRGLGVRIDGITPLPEPSTLLLLGTGLIGLAGMRRKLRA